MPSQLSLPEEVGDLRVAGDRMQSELSRIIEWVNGFPFRDVPYEVRMAVLESESAIEAWTATRRRSR